MSHFIEKSSDVVLFLKTEFSLELPIEAVKRVLEKKLYISV